MTKLITVHKTGDEGTLQIDALQGKIVTPPDLQPDWASGLAVALTASRIEFYAKRLGGSGKHFEALKNLDVLEYSDLDWIGVDGEGEETMIDHDPEFRAEVIARVLGINRDAAVEEGIVSDRDGKVIEVTAMPDRTNEEWREMQETIARGFGRSADKQAQQTGTNG